jgi:3-oxoacyl-[acyl-carrier protein] reductase
MPAPLNLNLTHGPNSFRGRSFFFCVILAATGEGRVGKLDNRVALVTGASRGIGKAIAIALAHAGCHLALNYEKEHVAAQHVVATIRQMGRVCSAYQADVSAPSTVDELIGHVEATFGQVDILVNNAGIAVSKPFLDLTLTDWEHTLRVNLTSAFMLIQRVLANMRARRWGRIINLSSVAAQTGGVIGPHYAASKAGLIGLTHSYASLLAKEGITVNAIAPALIETDMVTSNSNASPERLPVGFFGSPGEIGRAAVLLAESDFITGQTFSVNGGWYMT